MASHFVTQSRSAIGGGGASAHSSLSNKRRKSERGISHNSSSTAPANHNINHSSSKAKAFPSKPTSSHALKTLSFERHIGKGRSGGKLGSTAAASGTQLTSVHPYTVMAMPLHSISQHNLKETVLAKIGAGNTSSTAAIGTRKSSTRHSIGSNDPSSLTKMPKAFVKSHQTLQTSGAS